MKDENLDKKILSIVVKDDGSFNASRIKIIHFKLHYPELLNYISQRFEDLDILSQIKFKEIIFRIKNNLESAPVCPVCGKQIVFDGRKYPVFCSNTCFRTEAGTAYIQKQTIKTCQARYGTNSPAASEISKQHHIETSMKKYGVSNPNKCKEIANKIREKLKNRTPEEKLKTIKKTKNTLKERYGDENYRNIEKTKQTCMQRYGVEYASQTKEFQEKVRQTNLERYGVENVFQSKEIRDKIKQTCQEKYGVDFVTQTENQKEKSKQTCREHFGTDYALQNKEIFNKGRQVCKEKYGNEYPQRLEEQKEKQKLTNLEKYGCEVTTQSEIVKNKIKQTTFIHYGVKNAMQSKEIQDKIKQTNLEKYGVENAMQNKEIMNKTWETKRKTGVLKQSKPEEFVKSLFNYNNFKYKWNYNKDSRYPWHVDFYLSDYDLFIEIQGYWTHGSHPFNENDQNDIDRLNYMIQKNTKKYQQAINTWTISDPLKRKTAKENNLNYLEIFSCNEKEILIQISNYFKEHFNIEIKGESI